MALLFIALPCTIASSATAQGRCARAILGEVFTGSAWSVPLPLTVDVSGRRSRMIAHYGTRPFADAPYYSYRAGLERRDGAAVELEMLHHKLYMNDPRPPIDRLEITHGYNLPTANVTGPGHDWQWRVGIGVVVAHPEGRVGGREIGGAKTALGGGYHIAGITAQVAVGRRYRLAQGATHLYAAPEAKVTASWARVTVDSIDLRIPNIAFHALGGFGVRSCQ
jgi:hypothetical protein